MYSLEEIADRMVISDLYTYYVHAIDAGNYDDLDTVFLPDTMFDLSSAGGICGPWTEVKPWYQSRRAVYEHYFHMYGNLRITLNEARSSAQVKSKVLNPMGIRDEHGKLRLFQIDGSYEDLVVRMPDGWRIKQRVWIHGEMLGDYPFTGPVARIRGQAGGSENSVGA